MDTELELDWSKMLECEITQWVTANKLLMLTHPTMLDDYTSEK